MDSCDDEADSSSGDDTIEEEYSRPILQDDTHRSSSNGCDLVEGGGSDDGDDDGGGVSSDHTVEYDMLQDLLRQTQTQREFPTSMEENGDKEAKRGDDVSCEGSIVLFKRGENVSETRRICPLSREGAKKRKLKDVVTTLARGYEQPEAVIYHALYVVSGCPRRACRYLSLSIFGKICKMCHTSIDSDAIWSVENDSTCLMKADGTSEAEKARMRRAIKKLVDRYGPEEIRRRIDFLDGNE